MLKKGQCSNSPSKCNFAKDGTLLPYAGPSSICPECNAPLALVAMPPNAEANNNFSQSAPIEEDYYEEKPSQALEFAKIAAFILIAGGLLFFGFKFFVNQKNNEEITQIDNMQTNQTILGQIEEINPVQIAKVNFLTDVKVSPSLSASSMGTLSEGSMVDVTGKIFAENIEWFRIVIPNNSTQYGFVKAQDLQNLNQNDALALDPSLNGANSVAAIIPPEPVLGPIIETSQSLFYVSSKVANIRIEAGANAAKLTEALRGDTFTADASRMVDDKKWYRITLANGEKGWISASLLSSTKPVDEPEPKIEEKEPQKPVLIEEGNNVLIVSDNVKIRNIPEIADGNEQALAKRGMVVQVQEIENKEGVTWYKVRSKRFNIDGWVEGKSIKSAE